MCWLKKLCTLPAGGKASSKVRLGQGHRDTNVLALADLTALLEHPHFATTTIYFGSELPHSSSSPFKGQRAFGDSPHVYKHKYFAPAQLHFALNSV